MSQEKKYAWEKLEPLWVEYCGVADEYRMIEDKWKFFRNNKLSSALSNIDETLRRLDQVLSECEGYFYTLGYERSEKERYTTVLKKSQTISTVDLLKIRAEIFERLAELSAYTGTLKWAFTQRTASLEIPQTVSGFPITQERTVGNEALLVAADKVARRYADCLSYHPGIKWDGLVTFVYPIVFRYLYGAVEKPTVFSKIFHMSLSEEGKYFLGSYLSLAHESAHAAILKIEQYAVLWQRWMQILWIIFSESLRAKMQRGLRYYVEETRCSKCPINAFLGALITETQNKYIFEQCLADIIAVKIGGICTANLLADFYPTEDTLFRIAFLAGYFIDKPELFQELLEETCGLGYKFIEYLREPELCGNQEKPPFCLGLVISTAEESGKAIANQDRSLIKEIATTGGLSYETCARYLDLMPLSKGTVDTRVLEHILQDEGVFSITNEKGKEILAKLERGIPCFQEDSRYVLHVYYKFLRSGKDPSYTATLQSLALNTYKQNEQNMNYSIS